jgi:hypothetical protein
VDFFSPQTAMKNDVMLNANAAAMLKNKKVLHTEHLFLFRSLDFGPSINSGTFKFTEPSRSELLSTSVPSMLPHF